MRTGHPYPVRLALRDVEPVLGRHPGLAQPAQERSLARVRRAERPAATPVTTSLALHDAVAERGGGPCHEGVEHVVHRPRRPPRPRSDVTPRSAIPHGTMCPNMARSEVTLRATPCSVRRRPGPTRMVRTPMAAIFRGSGPSASTQTPGYSSTLLAPGSPRSARVSITTCSRRCTCAGPEVGSSGTVTIG